VPWSERLESKEEEVPDHVLVVMMKLVNAGNNMTDAQFLLSVLQQRHECMFAALGQLGAGDANIQSVLPEHCVPGCLDTTKSRSRETNLDCSILVMVNTDPGIWLLILACR